jgi:glutathione synthase/RimK-type ligase-like ATP-grasp enzyme
VSDVPAIIRAEHKPLQLLLAEDFGLRVPSTMITSDAEAATAFVESQPATVIKPLCSAALAGDVRHAFLAVRVHGTDGLAGELVNLKWAPAVFQRAIDAVADLRVTIVGDEVFVARLDVDREAIGQPGIRDWRIRQTDGLPPFEPDGTLSKQIRRACREMTRALGLKFSAIDLVVDVHGDVWFLELNPNGQWGFVELATGQPIGAAMAALLERDS